MSRSRAGAPKPNTNFLRHIIRQTDNHNAALLAKEAEESSSRLRQMNRGLARDRTEAVDRAKRKIEGRLTPPPKDEDFQMRRLERTHRHTKDDDDYRRERKEKHRDIRSDSRSTRNRDSSRDRHRSKRRREDSEEDRRTHKLRRSRNYQDSDHKTRHNDKTEYRSSHRKRSHNQTRNNRRSPPRSISRSQSRSPRRRTYRKSRHRERSRSPRQSPRIPKSPQVNKRRSASPVFDSDPLEAIVGPLPPTVRSRGRGTLKAGSMGIESRFSSTYDPSMDMLPASDAEDDWCGALEVMRDRERWKQQGAERLRAAGFKDGQINKWEKGGDPTEEDVVWSKRGQDREWDRGKVVDEDGDIQLKADWGRLK